MPFINVKYEKYTAVIEIVVKIWQSLLQMYSYMYKKSSKAKYSQQKLYQNQFLYWIAWNIHFSADVTCFIKIKNTSYWTISIKTNTDWYVYKKSSLHLLDCVWNTLVHVHEMYTNCEIRRLKAFYSTVISRFKKCWKISTSNKPQTTNMGIKINE